MPRGLVTWLAVAAGLGGLLAYDIGTFTPAPALVTTVGCPDGAVSDVIFELVAVADDAPAGEPTPLEAVHAAESFQDAGNRPGELADPVPVSRTEVSVALRDESGDVIRVYGVMTYGTGWVVTGYANCA